MNSGKFKVLKTWVTRDFCIIFQCQNPMAIDIPEKKKIYLVFDLKQQSCGVRFTFEKPEDAHANHAFIQILRKYCGQFTIREILQSADKATLVIPLLSGPVLPDSRTWTLRFNFSKPPLFSLISPENIIHVSFGQKGTFTKKHLMESKEDLSQLINVLPELLSVMTTHSLGRESIEEPENSLSVSQDSSFSKSQKELLSRLKRKLKTVKKTHEKIIRSLPSKKEVENAERIAHLLQSYAYLIKPEMLELSLDSTYTGCPDLIKISLNPEMNKGQIIEAAFLKARKLKRGQLMGNQQAEEAEQGIKDLETDIRVLANEAKTEDEVASYIKKYKLPLIHSPRTGPTEESSSKAFKTYKSASGISILVGKGSQENDLLTKSARSNDYWIHAVGAQGAHVIIPVNPSIRSHLPTDVLKDAAILAIHFSRYREDQAGECYVTRKGKIKKQKGMPAGLWNVEQAETIFFRYSKEELQKILQTVSL